MDYFTKFLRSAPPDHKPPPDDVTEFHRSWILVKNTLLHPDERQLRLGIGSTDVPARLKSMMDALLRESNTVDDSSAGPCMDYLLTNDVLNTLVRLCETDRPFGVQAEVLRTIANLVILSDEHFLVHSVIHKALLRLLRNCMGDDDPESFVATGSMKKPMGAAGVSARLSLSEYEKDLVNLLCVLCGRIRTYPELLMIFFREKNWASAQDKIIEEEEGFLEFDMDEEDGEEEEEAGEPLDIETSDPVEDPGDASMNESDLSATPTKHTVLRETNKIPESPSRQRGNPALLTVSADAEPSPIPAKPEYEFLIFNYLMRFVHREGEIGEYARAGLLFLIDIAIASGPEGSVQAQGPTQDAALALAEYILEGDFSEVLGAGLGAVYSLLPNKLKIKQPSPSSIDSRVSGGMMLGVKTTESTDEQLEQEEEDQIAQTLGTDFSNSPEFTCKLDHFLRLVTFLQDILRRMSADGEAPADSVGESVVRSTNAFLLVGRAIAQSIVDNVRNTFLQNVLYPSVLECSDTDGSAVAVISYIDVVLQTLYRGQLVDVLLDFLMKDDEAVNQNLSNQKPGIGSRARYPSSMKGIKNQRRRSSAMVLLELEAPNSTQAHSSYFSSLGRFTLKDLLISNIKSRSPPAGIAALKLLHTLFTDHCNCSVDGLLTVLWDPQATSFPTPHKTFTPTLFRAAEEPTARDTEEDDEEEFEYPGAERSLPSINIHNETHQYDQNPIFSQPSTTQATLQRQLGMYQNLISRINPSHNENAFSTGYHHYLCDALELIQAQCCYYEGLPGELSSDDPNSINSSHRSHKHRLLPTDPLIGVVILKLRTYFSHSPEFNVALTGAIAEISACANRSLDGWLMLASKEEDENTWGTNTNPMPTKTREEDCDGDDRSFDHEVELKLTSENPMPSFDARLKDPKAMPVLYTIFAGLVGQLDRYRVLIEDFDRLLAERRQGLVFSENLNDALSLALEISSDNVTPPITDSPSKAKTPLNTPGTSKAKSKGNVGSFMSSLLTPKKNKSKSNPGTPPPESASGDPATPSKGGSKFASARPFAPHYRETGSITVPSFNAPPPSIGPWSPSAKKGRPGGFASGGFPMDDDVFTMGNARQARSDEDELEDYAEGGEDITLSQLLDNVVILEEAIKELTAIIQARCSLGIDSIRYI